MLGYIIKAVVGKSMNFCFAMIQIVVPKIPVL